MIVSEKRTIQFNDGRFIITKNEPIHQNGWIYRKEICYFVEDRKTHEILLCSDYCSAKSHVDYIQQEEELASLAGYVHFVQLY